MRSCATDLSSELSAEEMSFLLSTLKQAAFAGKHLELGTAAGGTLWQMICAVKETGRTPSFVAVDPMTYFENQLETVKKNLSDHGIDPASVDLRATRSNVAFAKASAESERFDFIFIDASHKIKHVMQDLCWTRLLNPNGILMMHDYNAKTPGVTLPANHFVKHHRNYQRIGHVGCLLAIRKISASKTPEVTLADHIYAYAWSPLLQLDCTIKKWSRKIFK